MLNVTNEIIMDGNYIITKLACVNKDAIILIKREILQCCQFCYTLHTFYEDLCV